MAGRPYPNKHPGTCEGCRVHVVAGAGFITRDNYNIRWILACSGCTNPLGSKPQSAAGAAPPHPAKEAGPSKSADLNRLIKLMKMTTSATDGEALSAMRKANEWLARNTCDWEQMLLGKVSVIADPFAEIAAPPPSAQTAPPRDYQPSRPTAPPRPKAPPPHRPIAPTPKPVWQDVVDPFVDLTVGGVDITKPFDPRAHQRGMYAAKLHAAQARVASAPPPRTFTPNAKSSTPNRKSAPTATEL